MKLTYVSLLTPQGEGGISIIQLFGPATARMISQVFRPKNPAKPFRPTQHHLYLGYIYRGEENIDEVILHYLASEESFTGLETVEINCHGGIIPAQRIISHLESLGARNIPAHQIIKHAFKAHRLDRVQQEALELLLKSPTRLAVTILIDQYLPNEDASRMKNPEWCPHRDPASAGQEVTHPAGWRDAVPKKAGFPNEITSLGVTSGSRFGGTFGKGKLSGRIKYLISLISARGVPTKCRDAAGREDFNDHFQVNPVRDQNFTPSDAKHLTEQAVRRYSVAVEQRRIAVSNRMNQVSQELDALLASAPLGLSLSSPKRVVIIGLPNTGKSTLFNTLLGKERVIVHPLPGTTRDTIEEIIAIKGIPFRLVDTAGLRSAITHSTAVAEKEGIKLTKKELSTAELMILLIDAAQPLEQAGIDFIKKVLRRKRKDTIIIPVLNKIDLEEKINPEEISPLFSSVVLSISALKNIGIDKLEDEILKKCGIDLDRYQPGYPVIFTRRQYRLLQRAYNHLQSIRLSTGSDEIISKVKKVFREIVGQRDKSP